jgi:hypothetical protein
MTDEGRHEQVLDTLLGLQARLRGDQATRRDVPPSKPEPEEPSEESEAPALRLAPEPIAVHEGDVSVAEGGEGATSADRLAALSERLQRVERELSHAMDRLRTAEARYIGDDDDALEPKPPDPDRDVYHRVQELQDLASKRQGRRRR